jgi:hypothetical protein
MVAAGARGLRILPANHSGTRACTDGREQIGAVAGGGKRIRAGTKGGERSQKAAKPRKKLRMDANGSKWI